MKASGRSQHLKVIGATLLAAVLVFSGGQALHAEEWPPSIEDAIAVLENVSLGVVAGKLDGSHVGIAPLRTRGSSKARQPTTLSMAATCSEPCSSPGRWTRLATPSRRVIRRTTVPSLSMSICLCRGLSSPSSRILRGGTPITMDLTKWSAAAAHGQCWADHDELRVQVRARVHLGDGVLRFSVQRNEEPHRRAGL